MTARKPFLLLGLMLLVAGVYFFQDADWNGRSRLNLTKAIVERGSFQIDPYLSQREWATEDVASFNGHYYSDKAIGSSLVAVPFYFVIYNFARILALPLPPLLVKHLLTALVLAPALALSGLVMYRFALRLGATQQRALVATLAVALGTMLWPYSALYYGHVLAATFLIVAFYLLFSIRGPARELRPRRFFVAGLTAGMAFITENPSALIIAGLLAYSLFVLWRRPWRGVLQVGLAAVLGALLPLSAMLFYNYTVFGSPLAFGYSYEISDTFQQGMSTGFMGIHSPSRAVLYHITIDPRFGLFWASPILLLAPVGYILALVKREHRAEALLSGYAVAIMLLMNAGYYLWWGGNAFGPRQIIPCLPFFIVPLALLPSLLDIPAIVLTVLSIGQMLIPLMGLVYMGVDFRPRLNTFFVEGKPFEGFSILYQHGLPLIARQVAQGIPSWTLGAALGLPYWLSVPALILAELGLLFLWRKHIAESQVPDSSLHRQLQA